MISCATLNACNETDEDATASDTAATAEFLKQATAADIFEITAGMMAEDQGDKQKIHSFGQQLVHVHSRTSEALTTLARRKSVQLPEEITVDKKRLINQLEEKEGQEFDQAFTEVQITAHQEAIALYERADKEIQDAEIQGFVDQILPVLKEHLTEIQQVQTEVISK